MPRHQQITTCRRTGGPLSKHCSCEYCCLSVCSVCGGAEGSLTTDCPGTRVNADRHQEVYETNLDYTDSQGWHLTTAWRSPHFKRTEISADPPRADPRAAVAPAIDWTAIDRHADLQHELTQKAIAWVLADRDCEDRSAALARVQEAPDVQRADLKDKDVDFKLACRRVETADSEFRQVARRIVEALEQRQPVTAT